MKILYHHRTLGDGAEGIHVRSIVTALRQLGHTVRVLSPAGEPGIQAGSRSRSIDRLGAFLKSAGALYDVAEMAYCGNSVRRLSAAVRMFRPDAIYERYANYNYAGVWVGRKYGIPVLLEMNCPYSDPRDRYDEPMHFAGLRRRVERDICSRADRVIAVSSPIRDFLCDVGVAPSHVVVMPNGVDLDLFQPHAPDPGLHHRWGLDGKVVIGFAGILRPWHGLELLLEAFARVAGRWPAAHLLIVGDGPGRAAVEAGLRERGLTARATITGRQAHDRMRQFIGAMDVAVSPRATRYASPMKLLEYMAMGKAVVAPDMPNITDIVTHDVTGVLFRPGDVDSLVAALEQLVADDHRRAVLGRQARSSVEDGRSWRANARSVIALAQTCRKERLQAGH